MVVHPVPRTQFSFRLAVGLEGDVRGRPGLGDGVDVPAAEVSLVGGDFLHREVLSGRVQQRREKGSVVLLSVRDPGGGDDVGLGSAHQVSLEPFTLGFGFSPLVLHPSVEPGRAESRGIHGEGALDRRQGKARFRDETLEDIFQLGFLQDVEDTVEVGNPPDEAPGVGFSQIALMNRRPETVL